jgi:hypothetical protein
MRRRHQSPGAQARRNSIDCSLIGCSVSNWPRILRVQKLATSCGDGGDGGDKVIAGGLPYDWTCAACDGTALGRLAQTARCSVHPLYFRCAECKNPLHSPVVCPCVVTCQDEGVVFCSKACKVSFDDENVRVCDLVMQAVLAQAPAPVQAPVMVLQVPAPPLLPVPGVPVPAPGPAVLALVRTALVLGLILLLVLVLILTLFN